VIRATAGAAIAALALSSCGTLGAVTGGRDDGKFAEAIMAIATDPNCGHTDRLNVTLGPVPSGSIFLERNCPAPERPAAVPLNQIDRLLAPAQAAEDPPR
jgi:hypothetical protein